MLEKNPILMGFFFLKNYYNNALNSKKERIENITKIYNNFMDKHNKKINEINGIFN